MIGLHTQMKGFLRVRVLRTDASCRWDSEWFPNKLLDSGRNQMAVLSDWLTSCQLGTNNTAPSSADTALLGYVAGTTDIRSTLNGAQNIEPYFGWKRKVFRFAAGTTGGNNLSEVGVGWGTSGATLISRALIIDPITQNPTTVTPLNDEIVEVTYEMRYYPPLGDVVGPQIVLGGVTYDTVTRASEVTGSTWSQYIGSRIGELSVFESDWAAYDGELGTILQAPSGLSDGANTTTGYTQTYQNNSFQVGVGMNIPTSGWNLANGIRCARIKTTAGSYQTRFGAVGSDATIPKTISYYMDMRWMIGFTEKT